MGIYKKFLCTGFILVFLPFFIHAQVLININTAGPVELETLNGIGPSKAQAIIDYRTQNGPFRNIEDINNVSGIGDVTFSKIKDFITIGESNLATTTTLEATTNSPPASSSSRPSSSASSVHYGATSVSTLKVSPGLEVNAGRDRLGTVGSPLEFKAETNIEYTKNSIFVWNFGDGSEGVGNAVNHTYMYPGDYALVLKVSEPGSKAVSRVNVKITDPKLVIAHASTERIEIINNSKSEANLFGRALVVGDKVFNFPKDTIIKAGQKISFSANATGLYPKSSHDVMILILGEKTRPADIVAKIEKQKLEQIAAINTELTGLQNKLIELKKEEKSAPEVPPIPPPTIVSIVEEPIEIHETQTASALNAVGEVKSSKIKSWFGRIKSFFLGEFKIK